MTKMVSNTNPEPGLERPKLLIGVRSLSNCNSPQMECNSEDFNAVNRWRFAELAPSDLLRSLHCDLSDVDPAEFVRAKWMWTRNPKSFLDDVLSGCLVLVFVAVVLLLIPYVGIMLALVCSFATLL